MAKAAVYKDSENGKFSRVADRPGMITEKTGPQDGMNSNMAFTAGSFLFGNGGCFDNPLGFPGYGTLYSGSYPVYRWILQHPIVRLVRSIAISPIMVSTWEYEKADDAVADDYVDLVRRNFDPLRNSLLTNFFTPGRDMGWQGGEPIWEVVEGEYRLVRMKPLVQDATECLQDNFGNFVGLRNYVPPKDKTGHIDLPAPYKAWKYTYDGLNGYPYGRSWLENIRMTAWRDWLDCAQQLQKLGAKITGIVSIVISPAGSFPTGNPDKPFVTYRENAEKAINALARGAAGVWFPSLALGVDAKGNVDAMKLLAELAGKSATNIELADFGSNSPAITGILERMKHDEELMFAGGLRPPRTGLEAAHGAKADADVHTDTGTLNSELDDTDFADQLQPLVDAVLVANKGERAKGKVRINPASLVDRMASTLKALLLAGVNIPEVAVELYRTMDVNKMLKTLNVGTVKPFDNKSIKIEKSEPIPAKPGTPEPQGGRPKKE